MTVPHWIQNLDAAYEGVLLLDSNSTITFCNQTAARLLDRSAQFVVGQPFFEFFITEAGIDPHSALSRGYAAQANHLTKGPLPIRIQCLSIENSSQLIFIRDLSEHQLNHKMIHLLAKVNEEIGSSLDSEKTREQVVRVTVPLLADWAALFTPTEDGMIFAKSYHYHSNRHQMLHEYLEKHGALFCENPEVKRAVLRGEPQFCSLFPEKESKDMPLSQVLCLPLEVHHEVVGVLCLGAEYPKQFSESDSAIAQEVTQKFAAALENAQLHQNTVSMENQLLEAKRVAEQANQMKTRFLAAMSHEIRSPLSAILGFSELLLAENSKDTEQSDWAERILQNGSHLLRLVDDILNISKVESGRIELEFQVVSLTQLLNQLWAAELPKARRKNIDFNIRFLSPVPEYFISDSTRLYQILTNLVGNAIKFTSKGEVELSLRFEPTRGYLIIVVKDTGLGLSQEQAEKLFKPFSQADASHHRIFGGTGLGLAVSRHLARLMKGEVEILSTELGVGTQFQIILPITAQEGSPLLSSLNSSAPEISNTELKNPENPHLPFNGLKVMVVDDSADNCLLASRFLIKAGAEVCAASNGKMALEKVFLENPDIILMDAQMPELNGHEATRQLIARGFRGPIVALTAGALDEDRQKCFEAGCVAIVTKPFERDFFLKTIFKAYQLKKESNRQFLAPTAKVDMGD